MSFSPAQQGKFRPLLAKAWQAHCRRDQLDAADKDAARDWYENELEKATGCRSSKHCTPTRDFEAAMAHFERIVSDSIEWSLKAEDGDERRILHEVRQHYPGFDCPPEYIRAIACQSLGRQQINWPETPESIRVTIIRAIVEQARRQRRAKVPLDHPRQTKIVDAPF